MLLNKILRATLIPAITSVLAVPVVMAQEPAPPPSAHSPIFSVTVVERTVKAINYQYRSEPTLIDFRGTVLMPKAHGEAMVESKQGRTHVDVKLDNVSPPFRFGGEYLTYVLWALTPDGNPHNLAEVIPNGGNKAHLDVTTDLQAFALIVTAEPYSAVRRPSGVVVMENQIRADTVGRIEEVDAKYELLPRGQTTLRQDPNSVTPPEGPKVSMQQYEALSELYQAENAITLARQAQADRYAAAMFTKAQALLSDAQELQARKALPNRVVQDAREAAQIAEDARVIAEKHQQQDSLAQAQADAAAARQAQARTEDQLRQTQAQLAQARADADRAARDRAQAAAPEYQAAPPPSQAPPAVASQARVMPFGSSAAAPRNQAPPQSYSSPATNTPAINNGYDARRSEARRVLLGQLNAVIETRDTPRGLVVTVADADFDGASLRTGPIQPLFRLSTLLAAHPGLRIDVEGHSDSDNASNESRARAAGVLHVLTQGGLSASSVSMRNFGNARPLGPNTSAEGRQHNRRVEIVISGDSIGTVPVWDHTYSLSSR